MRGGTASCSVIVSDDNVGSPIVSNPEILIAMNLPSLDKFEEKVVSGGIAFIDSTLVERDAKRKDITVYKIPATRLASENNIPTLANMIIVGKILKVLGEYDEKSIEETLKKVIPAKHADMLEVNKKALSIGANY